MTDHGFLAMAPQYTTTGELLAASAHRRGLDVHVLPTRGGTGALRGRRGAHYHGGPAFAARVADDLDVALLEPADDWLTTLPHQYTGRRISLTTLAEARALSHPAFVKPPTDKSFPAAVHTDGTSLPTGLPPELPVQVSEVVTWAAEFRLYVLDGEVRTGSQYATYGSLDARPLEHHLHREAVREFAHDLLTNRGDGLPSAVVLDVGLLTGTRDTWAVVEANMAWFSNCYAADPDRTLDVVLRSAGPREQLAERDRRFCRDGRQRAVADRQGAGSP